MKAFVYRFCGGRRERGEKSAEERLETKRREVGRHVEAGGEMGCVGWVGPFR